jgi:hypothetical protein
VLGDAEEQRGKDEFVVPMVLYFVLQTERGRGLWWCACYCLSAWDNFLILTIFKNYF